MSIKDIQDLRDEQIERYIPQRIICWVKCNIRRPIRGFNDKRNNDGSRYSYEQQLVASRIQVLYVAHYLSTIGKSTEDIIRSLRDFAH